MCIVRLCLNGVLCIRTFHIDALSSDEDVTLEANANPEPAWQVSRSGITEGTNLPGYIEILVN